MADTHSEPDSDDEIENVGEQADKKARLDVSMGAGEEVEEEEEEEEEEEAGPTWEEYKAQGNERFKAQDYRGALRLYSQAIELNSEFAPLYGNRSAAALMLSRYADVVADCNKAIAVDASYVKGYHRCAKASLALGDIETAVRMYRECLLRDAGNAGYHREKNQAELAGERLARCEESLSKKRYTQALSACESVLRQCPAAKRVKLLQVHALNGCGRESEALSVATRMLRDAPSDATLLGLRARCLYLSGELEQASTHLKHALRSDPDNTDSAKLFRRIKRLEALKAAGNRHFKFARWAEAVEAYTECLAVDPDARSFAAKLYCNRATAYSKMRKHDAAVEDCTAALERDPDYSKALMRRAASLQALGEVENLENAVRDLTRAHELSQGSRDVAKALRAAKGMLKNAKRKDYYKILGVPRDGTEDMIKKAYRKSALKWHPDRWANKPEADQKKAETQFKHVNEAFGVLSDAKKRERYDAGVDIEDLDNEHAGMGGGGMPGGMNPNDLFSMFMGGGMGGMGGMRGGMGGMGGGARGGRGGRGHGGGFPGGMPG
eukprot:g4184.t1